MATHIGVLVNTTDDVAITTLFAWAWVQKAAKRRSRTNNRRADFACFILTLSANSVSTLSFQPADDVGDHRSSIDIREMMIPILHGSKLRDGLQFFGEQFSMRERH